MSPRFCDSPPSRHNCSRKWTSSVVFLVPSKGDLIRETHSLFLNLTLSSLLCPDHTSFGGPRGRERFQTGSSRGLFLSNGSRSVREQDVLLNLKLYTEFGTFPYVEKRGRGSGKIERISRSPPSLPPSKF